MKDVPVFRLDAVNQCLWRRNGIGESERILLTPTEYGVLDHLVEHAGRLVTHRQLLDAVWPRTVIEPQAVKSKIFHLRRAFDDDPKRPRFIETVARRGYRFVGAIERGTSEEPSAPAPTTRLAGRENPLAELRQCLRSASGGRLQIVFVTGEPGIGKTTLIEEFQRQVAASDRAVRLATGQCVEGFGSKEAFYPVLQAVGALCRRPDGAKFVDALASHAPTWLVQFPALLTERHRETLHQEIIGATRERMLREICEALEATTASTPLVLVLEDLHWADSSTLDLISALARWRGPARLMVISTYRPADVARSAQPLHALKRDLVARHLSREIVLQPLTDGEIAEYLSAGDGAADVPDELASLLSRHTEGNPLFMLAVLEHLVARSLLHREPGAWRLRLSAADISLSVPESLREMIAAQIERLGDQEQSVLEVAAIAGAMFAPAISAPTADLDLVAFDDCCNALVRRGQILRLADTLELPDGGVVQRYAFVHALYREVLYERQSSARRAMLHRRSAERMEELFRDGLDEVTPQLAHHFEKGTDWPRAVKYMRRAAALSARRCALDDARASLRRALGLAGHLPAPERAETEIAILEALGGMDAVTSHPQALETLSLLRQRAAAYGFAEVEAKALVDVVLPVSRADADRALEAIDQALALSDARLEPLARARIRAACLMRRIATTGWSDTDAAGCAEAMAEIRRGCTGRDLALHVVDSSFVDLYSSRYRKALGDVGAAMPVLTGDPEASTYLDFAVAHWNCDALVPWCSNLLGEWGTSLREADARIVLADRNADGMRRRMLLTLRAWTQLNAMDFAGVRALTDELLPEMEQPTETFLRRFAAVFGAAAEAGLGNHDVAVERLLLVRDEMDARPVMLDWYKRIMLQWVLTNVWLDLGDLPRARIDGELLLARALGTAERTWLGLAWESNARIALREGDVERASQFVGRGLAAIEELEVPVAAWQVRATAADVARARGDDASAARHLQMSRATVLRLADSLGPAEDSLRQTFVSAARVAAMLAEGA